MKKAFSLIELSIVILIIGILIAGITQSTRLIAQFRITSAKSLTQNSPVPTVKNLMLWLEAVSDASFDDAERIDGTPISTWKDVNPTSSYKNDAIQNTGNNKPTYIESCLNSLPCVRFTYVSNPLTDSDFMSYDGTFLVGNDITIFVVESRRSNLTGNYFLSGTGGSNGTNMILGYRYNNTITISLFGSDRDYTVPTFVANTPVMHVFKISATSGKSYYRNGIADLTGSGQTTLLSSYKPSYIGQSNVANFFYDGDIFEIIMFNRALKDEERLSIQTYLSKKWGIKLP